MQAGLSQEPSWALPRRAGAESPQCAEGLGSGRTLPLCPARPWWPRGAGSGRTTSPSLCPGGGTDVPPVPSPRAYRRDSRLAPAPGPRSHQCHPSCRRSAPDAHLECPRSSQVSAALAPPPVRHVNCTCKAGELSHTIYRHYSVYIVSHTIYRQA